MEWLLSLGAFFQANLGAILGFAGLVISTVFAFRTKRSGDDVELTKTKTTSSIEAARVAIELERVHNDERRDDQADKARQEARFDAFMARLDKEREEARQENAELRHTVRNQTMHLDALGVRTAEQSKEIGTLTRKVEELRQRVFQLIEFIRQGGGEPPPPRPPEPY